MNPPVKLWVAIGAIALAGPAIAWRSDAAPDATPVVQCNQPDQRAAQATALVASTRTRIDALDPARSMVEDIEATLLSALAAGDLCTGTAEMVLDQINNDGSPATRAAVDNIRTALNGSGGVASGFAANGGGGFGGSSFFSAPIVGISGGSATYTR